MDITSEQRSYIMRSVKACDTKPEMLVRRLVYSMGYRFRLHRKDLPGKPDLVFSKNKKVIFIHGCFWHGHKCKRGNRIPKTNQDYWLSKIKRNVERDEESIKKLKEDGWKVLIIWECEIKNTASLQERLLTYLVL